jgi:hypothetical protein
MADTRGERLRAARRKRFKSARSAALALAIPISTYGAHERAELPGGRDYGPEEARRYARYFEVAAEWLLIGKAEHSASATLTQAVDSPRPAFPIKGYVGTKGVAYYYEVDEAYLDRGAPLNSYPPTTICLELLDAELDPFEHWIVFFDGRRQPPTPDLMGSICVIGLTGGGTVVKKLLPGRREGLYDLYSRVGRPLKDVSVDWASPVLSVGPPSLIVRASRIIR